MIASPPPPVLEQPAPYEVSYGTVSGIAAPGAVRLVVRAGGRLYRDVPLKGRHFTVRLDLPTGETILRVRTVSRTGRGAWTTVAHVFALPRQGSPIVRAAHLDPVLASDVRRALRGFGSYASAYVESLTTGAGAASNARARFPAASTLKLAIAIAALSREAAVPKPGTTLDRLLRQMIIVSDDRAANAVEAYAGGSTLGGSARVNAMLRSLGLVDSEMYGGYLIERSLASSIPTRVDSQPTLAAGKYTTALDLASLARAVWLASEGLGSLRSAQPGFTVHDARYLLYLLAHVRDTGKLDRELIRVPGVQVLHKAGWISTSRHDSGLVFWRGGVFVATVMTYRPAGAGASSDALAGRIAHLALERFQRSAAP